MSEFKTYKFYTAKKQRIAAYMFAPVGDNFHVLLVFCSHKDNFNKKMADWVFSQFTAGHTATITDEVTGVTYHPKLETIPVISGKSKKSFVDWMDANFYRKIYKILRYDQPVLFRAGEKVIKMGKPISRPYKLSELL